jgi:hypothetical protein
MNCRRCQGLMMEDQFLDFEGPHGFMWTPCRRCVNCGHVDASAIEQHCLAQEEKVWGFPSSEPDYQDDEVHLGAEAFIRVAA